MNYKFNLKAAFLTALFFLSPYLVASEVNTFGNLIELQSNSPVDTVDISISGPDDFHYKSSFSSAPMLSLSEIRARKDGLYNYEFTEITILGEEKVRDDFNGRGNSVRKIVKSNIVSGSFRVINGSIVNSDAIEGDNESIINKRTGLNSL